MATFVTNEKNLPLIILRRCETIGLKTSITQPIINDFCRWVKCNGPQFAVDRMKTIKQIVLNYVATGSQIPKGLWIRKSNDFILAGCYGELQKLATQSDRMLKKVLTFFNMYTVLSQPETTEQDVIKFRKAVETPCTGYIESVLNKMGTVTKWAVREFSLDSSDVQYAPLYEQSGSQKPLQEAEFLDQVERLFRTDVGIKLIQNYPSVYTPLMNCLGFRGYRYAGTTAYMGRVFRIPNPGLKSRWVCDFNKPLDHCIKPLGRRLYESVEKLPWDITYKESKCYGPVQRRMAQGGKCYAFDLSSATDRFPWPLQLEVLRNFSVGGRWQEIVSLYDFCIHMPAQMPDGSSVTWACGQPLGAYPSFATFTLTHGLLLASIVLDLKKKWVNDLFFVHGDDLIVLDDLVAMRYESIMRELGVEISQFKTLKSGTVTEINSKILSSHSIMSVPKWKPVTRRNALSQIKNWGRDVISYLGLSPKSASAILRIASLPVCLGGSGVNPEGIPLIERIRNMEDLLFKEKELSYEGSSRSRVLKRYLANPNFTNLLGNALRDAELFDQKRLRELKKEGIPSIFGDSNDLDILGKNLYSVNPDVKAPIDAGSPESKPRDEVELWSLKLDRIHSNEDDLE